MFPIENFVFSRFSLVNLFFLSSRVSIPSNNAKYNEVIIFGGRILLTWLISKNNWKWKRANFQAIYYSVSLSIVFNRKFWILLQIGWPDYELFFFFFVIVFKEYGFFFLNVHFLDLEFKLRQSQEYHPFLTKISLFYCLFLRNFVLHF